MKLMSSLICAALFLSGCASAPIAQAADPAAKTASAAHPDAKPFDASRDAKSDVALALAQAQAENKPAITVMGANWCHDSRALAGWFATPRFSTMLERDFVLTYVDVGRKDSNLDVARSFGLDGIIGTPTVVVTAPDGTVLNLDSAVSWRNSANRSEDAIYAEISAFAGL